MQGNEVRELRKSLGLTMEEFADFLALSGYGSMKNIEIGFRRPSTFTAKFLMYLKSLPTKRAKALIEEINRHGK